MTRFFHVAIGYVGPQVPVQKIQEVFKSDGWARFAPNCWIVSSDRSVYDIAEGIRKIVGTSDSIFVCELEIDNNAGYLQKEIWDWIKKERSRISRY